MRARLMRTRLRGLLRLAAAASLAGALPAGAQETGMRGGEAPLFLRIRPQPSAALGSGGTLPDGPSDAETARQARAAREAVWERAAVRARIAIASVCTGCLQPERPAAAVQRNAATRADAGPEGPQAPQSEPRGEPSGASRDLPASLAALSDPPSPSPTTRGDP
ncbi:hypothetical protein [Methylobacterium planeticum]|uniref:hypothetical protein n=1 Tax=Methylobacterium planeticum TaxID=2615211 RepID=UPI00177FC920|nr:hypothetical protein [Methylobacterium planeticum]